MELGRDRSYSYGERVVNEGLMYIEIEGSSEEICDVECRTVYTAAAVRLHGRD